MLAEAWVEAFPPWMRKGIRGVMTTGIGEFARRSFLEENCGWNDWGEMRRHGLMMMECGGELPRYVNSDLT